MAGWLNIFRSLSAVNVLFICLLFTSNIFAREKHNDTVVTLQLHWNHQFQFAGYYAAKLKGYYQDAGLDVTIKDGGYDQHGHAIIPESEVLFNRAQFGTTRSDLLINHSRGFPLVVLANILQHSPYVFLTTEDYGFSRLEDIGSQRPISLNLPGSGDQRIDAEAVAALLVAGVDLSSLNNHFPTWDLNDLIQGKTQLMPAYITDSPYFLKKAGKAPVAIEPRDYGIDFYGDLLFTSEYMLKEQPEVVSKFRQASLEGWRYALAHPEEIVRHILDTYEMRSEQYDKAFLLYEAQEMRKLINPDVIEIGYINKTRWETTAKVYQSLGLIDHYNIDAFIYHHDEGDGWIRFKQWLQWLVFPFILLTGGIVYLLILTLRLRAEVEKRKLAQRELARQADIDSLTGIANRRGFQKNLDREFNLAKRYENHFTLLILDIDFFKEINDLYGHLAGDLVLQSLANVTQNLLRKTDHFARFGGEEFVILLPNTHVDKGLLLAKRILDENRKNTIVFEGQSISYTISIGVTEIADQDLTTHDLFKRADQLLYQAKDSGRDCIRVEGSLAPDGNAPSSRD